MKIGAAKLVLIDAQAALDAISSTAPPDRLAQWVIDEQQAQSTRETNLAGMKVYDIQIKKGNPENTASRAELIPPL